MNWAFNHSRTKVVLIGVNRNPEQAVVIMYKIVQIISKTYQDIASGKLQIRWFQPPHSSWRQ